MRLYDFDTLLGTFKDSDYQTIRGLAISKAMGTKNLDQVAVAKAWTEAVAQHINMKIAQIKDREPKT